MHLAELLARAGAHPARDLEQLWRRIVFSVFISNTDDHLRNHGFLLDDNGWTLSPAYDLNPVPYGDGLSLSISETDNAQDLDLVREVAPLFRVKDKRARAIIVEVQTAVRTWRTVARKAAISRAEQERMENAFRLADG